MYLTDLRIQGIKLHRDFQLGFRNSDGSPRMWTVLVGENGCGKTTVLQAIASAALGPDRANQLANIPSLPDRRVRSATASIEATFSVNRPPQSAAAAASRSPSRNDLPSQSLLKSRLLLEKGWSVFQGDSSFLPSLSEETGERKSESSTGDPLKEQRGKNSPGWFVAGYGVQRALRAPRSATEPQDPARDRVVSLFDRGQIIGTGFADLLAKDRSQALVREQQRVLLGDSRLLPRISAIELRGRGGVSSASDLVESHRFEFSSGNSRVKIPATWLSQGYQAFISWVADLIGQQIWEAGRSVPAHQMQGIVLVDELDLFLHPQWQLGLISSLRTTFPKIQFIVSTHSPMLLPGCERNELFILEQDQDGNIVPKPVETSPSLMTGSEIYRRYFGVEGLYPATAGKTLQRYAVLSTNPYRTDQEEAEMKELATVLQSDGVDPGWKPVRRKRSSR